MAQQYLYMFKFALHPGIAHLNTHDYKAAIIDNSIVPDEDSEDPRFGSGGGVDFSTAEVTPGGNYAAGGIDIDGSWTYASGVWTFDGAVNPYWAAAAGGPTNCYRMLIYNDSLAGKNAIAWVDLASDDVTPVPLDNTSVNISYTFAGTGIATVTATNPA